MRLAPTRIALTVVGGFLGSGKTTLLNHILRASPRKAAVLVNDFGTINIDANLLDAQTDTLIQLSNGCVCCSMGSGLEDALIRVLALNPRPEWIVIEASGVSDPGRIAQVGMADPLLQLEGVVILVDAASIRTQYVDTRLSDTVTRQIRAADLLVLNKIDLVPAQTLPDLRRWLADISHGAAMVETCEAQVDWRALMDGMALSEHLHAQSASTHAHPHPHNHPHVHHHAPEPQHPFQTWVWRPQTVLDADQLAQRLRTLPRAVIRAKGWVQTHRHGWVLVQLASRRVRYDTQAQPPENVQAGLVLISLEGAVEQAVVAAQLDQA